MTAFWPTSDPRTPVRGGRGGAATEGWLVMERWDDTCSPAARARRRPSAAIFTSRRAYALDDLQVEAPPGDGHPGGAALRRQHHHRHRAAHGGRYPAVRAGPGGGHRERGAVRDVRDRGTRGSRTVCVNGAAARLVQVGDPIIVISYAPMTPDEAARHHPNILLLNADNSIRETLAGDRTTPIEILSESL